MIRNRNVGWALALIASCLFSMPVWADSHEGEVDSKRGEGQRLHARMRAQMQEHDARLEELVSAMNSAQGEAKIEAIAAVVNELVAQRRTRRAHMDERWKSRDKKSEKEEEGADAP
jgi:hypothetical protein